MKKLTKAEQKQLAELMDRAILSGHPLPVQYSAPVVDLTPPPAPDAVKAILNQRDARYGDFTDHAEIAQDLQDVMRNAKTKVNGIYVNCWERLSKVQRQALTVDADKTARILSGDPDYDDNWIDKQGYARLAQERLPKPE